MDTKIGKLIQMLMYVLLGVSLIMIVAFYFGGTESITFASGKEYAYPSFTDTMIYWSYGLFFIATLGAVLFPIFALATDIKKAKSTIIGIGALFVIIGLAYVLASDAIPTFHNYEKFNITESISKNVGTGLFATYLLGGIAIIGILFSGVSKSIK